jgi:hypothetical protein
MLSLFTAEIVDEERGQSHRVAAAHTLIKSQQHLAGVAIDLLTPRAGSRPASPDYGWIIRELAPSVSRQEAEDLLGTIGEVTSVKDPVPLAEVAKLIGGNGVAKVFSDPEGVLGISVSTSKAEIEPLGLAQPIAVQSAPVPLQEIPLAS